jgi:hypothetical protein
MQTLFVSNPRCVVEVDGDSLLLMIPGSSEVIKLDKVSKFLWDHLQDPITLQSLISLLTSRYRVSQEEAQHDVSVFLQSCRDRGIVQVRTR